MKTVVAWNIVVCGIAFLLSFWFFGTTFTFEQQGGKHLKSDSTPQVPVLRMYEFLTFSMEKLRRRQLGEIEDGGKTSFFF